MGSQVSCCCVNTDDQALQPLSKTERNKPLRRTEKPSIDPELSVLSPFTNACLSTRNFPAKLIFEASRQPVESFQKSLESLTDRNGDPLFEDAESFENPSLKSKSKSIQRVGRDQSAALSFFTMRDHADAGYCLLQDALATEHRQKTRSWLQYLNLFSRALQKLDFSQDEFYQCIPFREDFCVYYIRAAPLYTGLCSVSRDEQLVEDHFKQNFGNQRRMILVYENVVAYNLNQYSVNNYEEYVTAPGQQLLIRKIEESHDVTIVYLTAQLKHFMCPRKFCGTVCNQDHKPNARCNACTYLSHDCNRHGKPICRCEFDNRPSSTLFECKKCHGKFCEECSMRDDDLWH